MKDTAVVILNYNGAGFLKQFLPTLIKFTPECELYVADNKSTDNSLEVLKGFSNSIETIILNENYGYAGGYNQALKQLNHRYFILLNSDVEVTKGWSEHLIAYLNQHETVAAVQPKLRDYHNREYFEYAGAAGGFIDSLGYPYCKGRIFDTIEKDTGQYDQPSEIFWASGACFAVRSSVFFEVGGFDASFFAHMEEIDVCWRMKNAGYKISYEPQSLVYHVGGGTLDKTKPRKTYLNFRNNLLLIYKNAHSQHVKSILRTRMLLDLIAAIKIGISQSLSHSLAILRAWKDFSNMKKNYSSSNISAVEIQQKSIVFNYYIRKRKKYSDNFDQ